MRPYIRSSIVVIIAAAFAAILACASTFPIHAETVELSDEQRAYIKSECSQIKGSLSQLHATDALLRVNRGQVYESISTNLMKPFNARVSGAGLDGKAMVTHVDQYQTALQAFRADYISYEKKIAETLRVDCTDQPDVFYQHILEARELRSTVHDDVTSLHQIMQDYGTAVDDFLVNYKRISE